LQNTHLGRNKRTLPKLFSISSFGCWCLRDTPLC